MCTGRNRVRERKRRKGNVIYYSALFSFFFLLIKKKKKRKEEIFLIRLSGLVRGPHTTLLPEGSGGGGGGSSTLENNYAHTHIGARAFTHTHTRTQRTLALTDRPQEKNITEQRNVGYIISNKDPVRLLENSTSTSFDVCRANIHIMQNVRT